MTSAPPRPDQSAPTNRPDPAPPTRPSGAQILASVLTATTSTLALSFLGVAGTIVGAGLASTFTVLANYWYTRTIQHTKRKVTQFAPRTTRQRDTHRTEPADQAHTPLDTDPAVAVGNVQNAAATSPTVGSPVGNTTADDSAVGQQPSLFDLPADNSQAPSPEAGKKLVSPARSRRRRFLLPIIGLFVLLLGVVTAIEYGLGKPLSDALRGKEGSGTSLSNVRLPGQATPDKPDVEPTDAPVPDGTDAPSEQPPSEPTKPGSDNTPPAPGPGEPEDPTEPDAPAQIPQPDGPAQPGDNAAGPDKPGHNPSAPAEQPQSGEPTKDPARLIVSASQTRATE